MIKSKSFKRYQLLLHIIMIVLALIVLLPILLLLSSSLTSERSLIVNGYSFFPKEFSLEAYKYMWNNRNTILTSYRNTIIATAVGTTANVLLTATMAYPLSLKKLPGRNVLSFLVLFTMLFNGGLVPSYLMWTGTFHIKNTIWALILPNYMLSAMNIILVKNFYVSNIPEAIYEAAEIDGASYFRIFRQIVLPLGKPIIVTITVFSGLTYWNDWTNGLYYINKANLYSIQSLLNKMILDIQAIQANATAAASTASAAIPQVSTRMAIAFVALAPILVIYPFLQKYFASGIALGAVKG